MPRPRIALRGPVLDSDDPVGLAHFYDRLLGWGIADEGGRRAGQPEGDGWAILVAPDGRQKLELQFEPQYRRPVWPTREGEPQMMSHLDVAVDDLDQGVAWALECGAELAEHQPQDDVRVLLDPAGHPFCVFAGKVLPAGYRSVTPRIAVRDVAGTVGFLREVLGAVGELADGRPTELMVGDSRVLVAGDDVRGEHPGFLYVYVDDPDATYATALERGATSVEPPCDTPYGDRRATFEDPYGNLYQVARPLPSS